MWLCDMNYFTRYFVAHTSTHKIYKTTFATKLISTKNK